MKTAVICTKSNLCVWACLILMSCFQNTSEKPIEVPKILGSGLLERANSHYINNNYDLAIQSYDSLILQDSSNAEYFFKRAYSKSMLVNKKAVLSDYKRAALSDYKMAIQLNYVRKEVACQNLAVLYHIVFREYDSAIYYYENCLKINADNQIALKGLKELRTSTK